jgi:hypothetical protein
VQYRKRKNKCDVATWVKTKSLCNFIILPFSFKLK